MQNHQEKEDKKKRQMDVKQAAIRYHQAGMNGAQAVLKPLMDDETIPTMPDLLEMTTAWKGGVGGGTCSAYAAATLAIGFEEEEREENLRLFHNWFKKEFQTLSCREITDRVGGRPSKEQKSYCDMLSAQTAEFVFNMLNNTSMKENI